MCQKCDDTMNFCVKPQVLRQILYWFSGMWIHRKYGIEFFPTHLLGPLSLAGEYQLGGPGGPGRSRPAHVAVPVGQLDVTVGHQLRRGQHFAHA